MADIVMRVVLGQHINKTHTTQYFLNIHICMYLYIYIYYILITFVRS